MRLGRHAGAVVTALLATMLFGSAVGATEASDDEARVTELGLTVSVG